jgi:uncharacterized protein (TIGR00159 family)
MMPIVPALLGLAVVLVADGWLAGAEVVGPRVRWVRETRALRAVLGLAVLGVLSLFAHWAGLIMTGGLFQSLWSMGLLLIVIAFQPEIRRALERMNPLDVLRGQRVVVQRETLAKISMAVFGMARDKVGALVVLPGREAIEAHLREGIPLEALVSRELLCTLFQPPSPTQDGAVVIRASRVERAACFLHMTSTSGLPSDYGARHHAAIGLTERCDALCVLVSEERGAVALARQGTLTPVFEPGRLQRALEHELQGTLSDDALRGGRWAWLRHNLGAKGLAVGLAVVLWTVVVGRRRCAPPGAGAPQLGPGAGGHQLSPLTKDQVDLLPGIEITEIPPVLLRVEVGRRLAEPAQRSGWPRPVAENMVGTSVARLDVLQAVSIHVEGYARGVTVLVRQLRGQPRRIPLQGVCAFWPLEAHLETP